ncbi:MAG: penicillin-binding protein 2 [Mariprofundaceae bacterium]
MDRLRSTRGRFERRTMLFHLCAVALLLLLMIRLLDLQWFQYEGLFLQAEQNRINILPVIPTRGKIVDRFGKGLAINNVSYQVTIIPERVENMAQILSAVSGLLQWDEKHYERAARQLKKARADRPVLIAERLSWEQVAPLSARLHRLHGVDVQAGTHRHYPYARLTSHLIGYLSSANSQDVKHGFLPIEKVGRSGAEKIFESQLHGSLGAQYEEVDAFGRRVGVLKKKPSAMGNKIRLSLDIELQEAAAKALGDRAGAVVVMDVHTGEILTLLSQPGVDSNRFILGLDTEQWQSWLKDERQPLLNRATQSSYPPASTFKVFISMAGLSQHLPLINQRVYCPGYLELGDSKFRCWKKRGHGYMNMHDALVQSCDVYFYALGKQLGIKRMRSEAERWGFGAGTGIALQPESKGLAPGSGRKWYLGETVIAAIGQGKVTATPLQMARFAAAIANGGQLLKPQLLAGQAAELMRQIELQPEHMKRVQQAMRDVVASRKGTAHASLFQLPWEVAGKTGTAQVVAMPQDLEKKRSLKNWHKDHAWFIGFAPYKTPRIAFAIFVEHGGHGGSAAGPVAAAIVQTLAAREASNK